MCQAAQNSSFKAAFGTEPRALQAIAGYCNLFKFLVKSIPTDPRALRGKLFFFVKSVM